MLNVDTLRANAVAKAGSDTFGDEWFLEPLTVLVKALNDEAQLSEMGLNMTERRLTALLVDRLRLRALQAANPEILDVQVEVVAEILGLPRTGSTLLHRLMSASPQLTSTLSWECSYPLPFPGESPAAEVRKGKAKKSIYAEPDSDDSDLMPSDEENLRSKRHSSSNSNSDKATSSTESDDAAPRSKRTAHLLHLLLYLA